MSRPMLTVRVARWSAEHPWRAIVAWLLFVAICIGTGSLVGTKNADFDDGATGELARYQEIAEQGRFTDPARENVLISARSGSLDPTAGQTVAAELTTAMRALPEVSAVTEAVPSPKGTAVLVGIEIRGDPDTADDRVQPLLDTTARVAAAHPDLLVEQVGGESLNKALSETIGKDFQRAELISIPVTLLIMLLAFGAVIAAGVPVLLAMSAVGSAIGLAALVSQLVPATENTTSMILLIGMAVGVDYSLFYVKREREERAKGHGHLDAVEIAAATSGHAIVVSGIAVVVAMCGMFLADDVVFTSIAIGASLVVLVAMIGSITVLPALLAKLGRWIDRPRVPLLWRLASRDGEPRLWRRLLAPTLRRPAVALVLSGGVLLGLAIPALSMTLNSPSEKDLPRSIPIMQSYDRMTEAFPSTGADHAIAVRVPAERADEARAALTELTGRLAADPRFAADRSPQVRESADHTVYLMAAGIVSDSSGPEADATLTTLRNDLLPATVGQVPGAEFAVSGETAGENEFVSNMTEQLPLVIGFVLVLTFIVMLATFRAPVIALTAIGLNALSAAAAYGVLVLVFQQTWAEGLLGFTSTGGIVAWLPVVLFVTLFGLSMDYHVFVVSRIREAAHSGLSTRDAVAKGITTSAGVVTSAAAVMVGVFSIFATLTTIDMKQMGVGLAVAIVLDATLIRAVLLPSLMTVLGKANWWTPGWLRRREPVVVAPAAPRERERELDPVG